MDGQLPVADAWGATAARSKEAKVEPPKKRVKLAAKNDYKLVKGFFSGVLITTASLVGAAAALLATVPESIREEAMRGL